jgi:hypothetical protein
MRFHALRQFGWFVLSGAVLGMSVPAHAERILIDFGHEHSPMPSPDAQGLYWNNMIPIRAVIDERVGLDLVTTKGQPSGIRIEVVGGFQNAVQPIDVVEGTMYPKEAADRWVVRMRDPGVLVLRGLRPGEPYSLAFFATRGTAAGGVEQSYSNFTVAGVTKELQVLNNTQDVVEFPAVNSGSEGTLKIEVSRGTQGQGIIAVLDIRYGAEKSVEAPKKKKKRMEETPAASMAPVISTPPPAAPAAPSPAPAVAAEEEGESHSVRLVLGAVLLALGLGAAGFVVWYGTKK